MKVKDVHIFYANNIKSQNTSSSTIEVEGLGEVTIKDCFSDELLKQIESEASFMLKQKLNIQEKKKEKNEHEDNIF